MNIENRIKSLRNAYDQLVKALDREMDYEAEIDPEKMKITLGFFELARKDSQAFLHEILELEGKVIVDKADYEAIEKSKAEAKRKKSGGLTPEARNKR